MDPRIMPILAEAGAVKTSPLVDFVPPAGFRGADASVEVEEWAYVMTDDGLQLASTCTERRLPHHLGLTEPSTMRLRRFVVVLKWQRIFDSCAQFREIGPWFEPRPGSDNDRIAALKCAMWWARDQAEKLNVLGPSHPWPAREE